MKKYVVEFIGTFFLVLAVCAAVRTQEGFGNFAPLAIGLALMAMIYASGHISGAHFNPAVSLAVFIRGKTTLIEMIGYWVVQLVAGVLAALITSKVFEYSTDLAVLNAPLRALSAELIGSFALAYVVLNVSTSATNAGNQYYGMAIAFTVVAMAYAVGSVSGGAFNPAVALGLGVFGKLDWSQLWVYLAGSFGGGIIAAIVYKFLRMDA